MTKKEVIRKYYACIKELVKAVPKMPKGTRWNCIKTDVGVVWNLLRSCRYELKGLRMVIR